MFGLFIYTNGLSLRRVGVLGEEVVDGEFGEILGCIPYMYTIFR